MYGTLVVVWVILGMLDLWLKLVANMLSFSQLLRAQYQPQKTIYQDEQPLPMNENIQPIQPTMFCGKLESVTNAGAGTTKRV